MLYTLPVVLLHLLHLFYSTRSYWILLGTLMLVWPMASGARADTCQQQLSAAGLPASGCNRAFSLHVTDMRFDTSFDGEAAPPGRQWLIMDVRFDNWITADLIYKLGYQEAVLVGSLARQLYLLVDDRLVVRPRLPAAAPGGDTFVLGQVGSQKDVRVAFAIPEEECSSLILSYHHDQYADIVIPLMGEVTDAREQRQSALQQGGNDVMSLGLHDVSFHDSWLGEPAPEGMHWLVADLRGQSEWQTQIDALAVRSGAEAAAKAPLPRVMEYVGGDVMLQAVVDGQYSYLREQRLSSLQVTPAWLTHAWAGGDAVFAIPRDAEQVELVAYFGEFIAPGIASLKRSPIRLPVSEGEPLSEGASSSSLMEIADSPTPVTLHGASTVENFAGHQAEDGETLLLLDVSMANTSDEGGMMRVSERFQVVSTEGQSLMPVGVYLPGPQALAEPFLLPAQDQRRFRLLYRLNSASTALQLEYAGVSVNERVPLGIDLIDSKKGV